MNLPESPSRSASSNRLVLTAERLFAQHGIDGVSLRQISAEAGSGNNSAVHYHFGSKQGLVAAIFGHRLPQLIKERQLLAARRHPDDLRSHLEAYFLPVFMLAEAPDNRYVSFVEQLQRHELGAGDGLLELPPEGRYCNDEFRRELDKLLSKFPEPIRRLRIDEAQSLCIHMAADRDRAMTSGSVEVPFEAFVDSFFDGLCGFLSAPASDKTQLHLNAAGASTPPGLWLL